jgi:SAM-dependent methyltransferase
MIKFLAKRALAPFFRLTASRQGGLDLELKFWRSWIKSRGLSWPEDFSYRFDPHAAVRGIHLEILSRLPQGRVRILDVGAGPLTAIGKQLEGYEIAITAVDPLAAGYDRLLTEAGLVPPVRTVLCAAEQLTDLLPIGQFDWVHAQNCIDHSIDPLQSIRSMVRMARPGGLISLYHEENEAEKESWRGLHQWNFSVRDRHMTVTGTDGRTTVLDRDTIGADLQAEVRSGHVLAIGSA